MVLAKQGLRKGLIVGYQGNTQLKAGIASTIATAVAYSDSGAIADADTVITVTGGKAMTLAQPEAGRLLIIRQLSSGENTVTCTVGTLDQTNTVATFNAADETLILLGVSSNRWLILANIGSVALS